VLDWGIQVWHIRKRTARQPPYLQPEPGGGLSLLGSLAIATAYLRILHPSLRDSAYQHLVVSCSQPKILISLPYHESVVSATPVSIATSYPQQTWKTHFQPVILSLKFSAKFLQLLPQRNILAKFSPAMILFLLQLISTLLVLQIVPLQSFHFSKEISAPLLKSFDFLDIVEFGGLVVKLTAGFANLPLCSTSQHKPLRNHPKKF